VNTKNIAILAIVTLVLVVIAAQFTDTTKKPETTQAGTAFFPGLLDELKSIDSIHIQTANEDFTVNKVEEVWGLAATHNYPVAMDKVSKILNGMSSFILLEKKTAKPELYERLQLRDITTANAQSTLIELKKGETVVASLLLGKHQTAKSDNTRTEMYVRKPSEEQTWLVMGTLSYFSKSPNEWLEKAVSDIDGQRIRTVSITRKDAEAVKISKEKEADNNYQLADLPVDAEVGEAYKLNNLARSLDGLNLDDVVPADGFEFSEDAAQIVFNSFDGLEVTAKAMAKEGKYYLQLMANAKPETAMPLEEEKTQEEKTADGEEAKADSAAEMKETAEQRDARVAKEAEAFNQKVSAWVYIIPEYKYNNLLPNKADLFKLKEKQEDAAAESTVPTKILTESPATESQLVPQGVAETAKPVVNIETKEAEIPSIESHASNDNQVKADFVQMLKEAAKRAKENPQAQNALAHPITVQNLEGEKINLPDLFREAAERAKQQVQEQEKE